MAAGEFGTVRDHAIAVKLSERQVNRQMRLAGFAPPVSSSDSSTAGNWPP